MPRAMDRTSSIVSSTPSPRRSSAAAVRTLARRSSLEVEAVFGDLPLLPPAVESTLYFVAAEALTNAARHARARTVEVRAEQLADGRIRLSIEDDGNGGLDRARGSGLTGLADRVEALGGELDTGAAPGGGSFVRATVPLPEALTTSRPAPPST